MGSWDLAWLVTRDAEDARDAVQDALAGLYRRWARLPVGDEFEAYVHRTVVNACLGVIRRRPRALSVAQPEGLPTAPVGPDPAQTVVAVDEVWRLCGTSSRRRSGRRWCCGSTGISALPTSPWCWAARSRPPGRTSIARCWRCGHSWRENGDGRVREQLFRDGLRQAADRRPPMEIDLPPRAMAAQPEDVQPVGEPAAPSVGAVVPAASRGALGDRALGRGGRRGRTARSAGGVRLASDRGAAGADPDRRPGDYRPDGDPASVDAAALRHANPVGASADPRSG
ncbi:MAG: sigma factor [Propionicimonas sp.]